MIRRILVGVFLISCFAVGQSLQPVSVTTAKLAESSNGLSVNVVIKNTGNDTLRDLKYVWYLDWSDHKGNLVSELDWTDIPNVTSNIRYRDDYVAEATFNLTGLALAPGQERHLNTRFHMHNWSNFDLTNDWSYAGLVGNSFQENGMVALYSGSERIWGSQAENRNLPNLIRDLQVRTVVSQHSPNTLGIDAFLKNTGSVPLTRVLVKWIASTQGRSSGNSLTVDWTDVQGLTTRAGSVLNGTQEMILDLGSQLLGVGEEKVIKFRLTSSDWTPVDFTQDPSYAGLGQPNDVNHNLSLVISGYPIDPAGDTERDSDGDGYSDLIELAAGSDPNSAASTPNVGKIINSVISDTAADQFSSYDFSSLPGYSTRNNVPVTFAAGTMSGLVPLVGPRALGSLPVPNFDSAIWVGRILEVTGTIKPGQSVEMAFPLPDQVVSGLSAKDVQLRHFVGGRWVAETVTNVANGAVYARVSSFSPFAIGVRLQLSDLSGYGAHTVGMDKSGTVWALGANDFGQLGIGSVDAQIHQRLEWITVLSQAQIVAVSVGRRHSLALDILGNVWAWGDNTYGQVGLPIQSDTIRNAIATPVKIWDATASGAGVVSITAGGWASYAIRADGKLLAWGRNQRGQLGLGDTLTRSSPTEVPALSGVGAVAAGDAHAAVLISSNIYAWGDDSKGQLGRKSTSVDPVLVPTEIPFDLLPFGYISVSYSGSYGYGGGVIKIPYLNPPGLIYAKGNYTAVRCSDFRSSGGSMPVIGWGDNTSGQIKVAVDSANILNPSIIYQGGRDAGYFGPNHILRSEYRGFKYIDTIQGGRWLYWTASQGSNLHGESGTDSLGKAKVAWKYQKLPGSNAKLESVLMAAGEGYSVAVNRLNDSVYAWGGNFSAQGSTIKLDETRSPPVVAIASPLDGATVKSLTTSVAWTADGVNQTTQTTQNLSLGWNRIQRCATKLTGETGCASVLVNVDTSTPTLRILNPGQDTVVNAASFTVRYRSNGVAYDTTVSLSLGMNRVRISKSGATDSVRILRPESGKISAFATAPKSSFAYTSESVSGLSSVIPQGVTVQYALRQISGGTVQLTQSGGQFDFLTHASGVLRFELEVKDSANVPASSKDTVSLTVREPVTLWEQLQVLQTGRNLTEGSHSISITAPSPEWSFAVTNDTVALYGLVDLDSIAHAISWKHGLNDSGSFTTSSGDWVHPNLTVTKGDNLVRYIFVDDSGKVAVDRALVTYRDSMQVTRFDVSSDRFYSGQNLTHQVRVRGQFEPSIQKLELVQITAQGTRVVATLNDGGLSSDTLAGDGVWSGSFSYNADTAETVYLRVRATFASGADESQIWSFYSQPEIVQADVLATMSMNDSASTLFGKLGSLYSPKVARDSVLSWLKARKDVKYATVAFDGLSVSWTHKSGVIAVIGDAPDSTQGNGTGTRIETFGVDIKNTPQDIDPADSFYQTIKGWAQSEPNRWDIDSLPSNADFEGNFTYWSNWAGKKAVFVSAHGGVWEAIRDTAKGSTLRHHNVSGTTLLSGNHSQVNSMMNDDFIVSRHSGAPKFVIHAPKGKNSQIALTSEYFRETYQNGMDGTLMFLGSCQGARTVDSFGVELKYTMANEMKRTRFGGTKNAMVGFDNYARSQVIALVGKKLLGFLKSGVTLTQAMDSIYNDREVGQSGKFGVTKVKNGHYLQWDDYDTTHGGRFTTTLRYYGDSNFVLVPSIKASGSNAFGQLGNGNRIDTSKLVSVHKSDRIVSVAASHAASAGLLDNGKVVSWGSDYNDELGDNDTSSPKFRTTPDSVIIMQSGIVHQLSKIKSLKGANHGWAYPSALERDGRFIALDSLGKVWVWGKNDLGQTGLPSSIRAYRAKNIAFSGGVTALSIEAGGQHGIALLSDGTVGTFGYGYSIGQGQESSNGQYLPRQQGVGQVLRRNLDAGIMTSECPDFDTKNRMINNIVAVGAGAFVSFAITADDTVFAWGNNYNGEAGISSWVAGKYCAWVVGPLTGKHLVAISGGTNHTLGLDKDGQVWAWGSNESGATGLGGIEGWVSQWTSGSIKPTKLSIPGRVVKISAGDFFNAVLDSDGNAYVWGSNNHGQLGLGHTHTVPTPTKLPGKYRDVVAGTAHILAVPK